MFERTSHKYDSYFLPGPADMPTDEAVVLGENGCSPSPANYSSCSPEKATSRTTGSSTQPSRSTASITPPKVYEHHWTGGSILVPWAGEKALLEIDEYLAVKADAV